MYGRQYAHLSLCTHDPDMHAYFTQIRVSTYKQRQVNVSLVSTKTSQRLSIHFTIQNLFLSQYRTYFFTMYMKFVTKLMYINHVASSVSFSLFL